MLLASLLVILVVIGLYFVLKNTPNKGGGVIPTLPPAKTQTSKPTGAGSTDKSSVGSNSAANTNASSSTGGNLALISPYGSFVSNHHPNLDGSPAPSEEQSVCNTTPGASCYIQFTKEGVTKTLPTETADSNGVVSWSWDINQAGFTTGSWQITAIASLNGQTKTTQDPMSLEVGP